MNDKTLVIGGIVVLGIAAIFLISRNNSAANAAALNEPGLLTSGSSGIGSTIGSLLGGSGASSISNLLGAFGSGSGSNDPGLDDDDDFSDDD